MTLMGESNIVARGALATALLSAALAVGAGDASAATGFAPPQRLASPWPSADLPQAAVAQTGRTAVLWRSYGLGKGDKFGYVAAIGDRPDALGTPKVLPAGRRAAETVGQAALLAFPDGGFAACFGSDPRRGTAVAGCSFAPPSGEFGPLRAFERVSWTQRPRFSAVARADGRVLVVTSRVTKKGRALRSLLLSPSGGRTAPQLLGPSNRYETPGLAALDDGTVAVAWPTPGVPGEDNVNKPLVRVMPAGSDAFGPAVDLAPGRHASYGITLRGGPQLTASFTQFDNATSVVLRRPDGSFAEPQSLPRPAGGFLSGSTSIGPDGEPFTVVQADEVADTDCSNVTASVVGTGALAPGDSASFATRLSKKGQIAQLGGSAVLADGTRIVLWGNAYDAELHSRLQVAVQDPGASAFSPSQVLPMPAYYRDYALASGGGDALIVWTTRKGWESPSEVVVSALRRSGPLAPQAALPSKPGTGCA